MESYVRAENLVASSFYEETLAGRWSTLYLSIVVYRAFVSFPVCLSFSLFELCLAGLSCERDELILSDWFSYRVRYLLTKLKLAQDIIANLHFMQATHFRENVLIKRFPPFISLMDNADDNFINVDIFFAVSVISLIR